MVRKSYFRSKRFTNENNIQKGTRGGDHGRLPLPIVTTGGGRSRRTKRMVRSNTRIRPGITYGGGRIRRTKRMVRSGTRIRPGITSGGGRSRRTKRMVRSGTRIRPGITA